MSRGGETGRRGWVGVPKPTPPHPGEQHCPARQRLALDPHRRVPPPPPPPPPPLTLRHGGARIDAPAYVQRPPGARCGSRCGGTPARAIRGSSPASRHSDARPARLRPPDRAVGRCRRGSRPRAGVPHGAVFARVRSVRPRPRGAPSAAHSASRRPAARSAAGLGRQAAHDAVSLRLRPPLPLPPSLPSGPPHQFCWGGVPARRGRPHRPVLGGRRTIRGSSPLAASAPNAGAVNVGLVGAPCGLTAAPLSRTRARCGCIPRRQAWRRPSMMPRTEAGRPGPRIHGAIPCTPHWQTAPCCLGMCAPGVLCFSLHLPRHGRGWGLCRDGQTHASVRGAPRASVQNQKRSGGGSAPPPRREGSRRASRRGGGTCSRHHRCAPFPRPAPGEPAGRGAGASERGRVSNSQSP